MGWLLWVRSALAFPVLFFWPALIGFVLLFTRHYKTGRLLLTVGIGGLYLFSTGFMASFLAHHVERIPAIPAHELKHYESYDAVVVLGGGREKRVQEFDRDEQPNHWTAARLRYGAFVYKKTGVPILVSGGLGSSDAVPEAQLMADSLILDYIANVKWLETQSKTTWENAHFSAAQLLADDKKRILLVTTAAHMPRAVFAFEHAGFTVKAAPTDFSEYTKPRSWAFQILPSDSAFAYNRFAMHEVLGGIWYRIKALASSVF